MNPVFLKHKEKIEYSEYDGSDLVYPGDKKGAGKDKKNSDADKSKQSPGNPTGQQNKAGAKPSADGKQGGNQSSTQVSKNDSKSGQDKAGNRASVIAGNSSGLNNTPKKNLGVSQALTTGSPKLNNSSHLARKTMTDDGMGTTTQRSQAKKYASPMKRIKSLDSSSGPLKTLDFELAGKVMGNEFRSQITERANETGVTGYVGRTNIGTIAGALQGPSNAVDEIKLFIKEGGTDKLKIDKCVFKNEKAINKMSLVVFIKFVEIIKRDPNDNILTQSGGSDSKESSSKQGLTSPKKK